LAGFHIPQVFFWAFTSNPDTMDPIRNGNQAVPKNRRKTMRSKKEEKTKTQPKTSKKAISQSAAAKTDKRNKESKRTIKQVVIEAISGKIDITNDEMIAAVKAEFPKSAFNNKHAAWYRTQARKGLLTGSQIEIPAQARKQTPKNN
jgi:hypothetical protein